ncbi:hypothetical protein VK98_00915 [Chromobacterium sp. LK11]|nr:hypothetical protein VK98_00915 [Chromobacterium sp. LK11]
MQPLPAPPSRRDFFAAARRAQLSRHGRKSHPNRIKSRTKRGYRFRSPIFAVKSRTLSNIS